MDCLKRVCLELLVERGKERSRNRRRRKDGNGCMYKWRQEATSCVESYLPSSRVAFLASSSPSQSVLERWVSSRFLSNDNLS